MKQHEFDALIYKLIDNAQTAKITTDYVVHEKSWQNIRDVSDKLWSAIHARTL